MLAKTPNARKLVLISVAEKDNIFTPELRHKPESIFSSIEDLKYHIDLSGGAGHRFTIRSDENIPAVRCAKNKILSNHDYWLEEFEQTE
ncbi:hypothetical protein B5S30_g3480 [[Candida] boidinii]|nr:hypothetical protein B5S30_g3480 [[Candida] boidinii]